MIDRIASVGVVLAVRPSPRRTLRGGQMRFGRVVGLTSTQVMSRRSSPGLGRPLGHDRGRRRAGLAQPDLWSGDVDPPRPPNSRPARLTDASECGEMPAWGGLRGRSGSANLIGAAVQDETAEVERADREAADVTRLPMVLLAAVSVIAIAGSVISSCLLQQSRAGAPSGASARSTCSGTGPASSIPGDRDRERLLKGGRKTAEA
jgi:hypothetical protein